MNTSLPQINAPVTRQIEKTPDMASEALFEFRRLKSTIQSGKSVNLICSIGGREIDVYQITRYPGGFLSILSKDEDVNEFKVFAHSNNVAFIVLLVADEKPTREIGYKAEMEYQKSQIT